MVILAHVAGSMGSGKTFICNIIHHETIQRCLDLDDYFWGQIFKNDKKISRMRKNVRTKRQYKELIDYWTAKYKKGLEKLEKSSNEYILVGIPHFHFRGFPIVYPVVETNKKYFIKIKDTDLIYQFITRTLSSITAEEVGQIAKTKSTWLSEELLPQNILKEHRHCRNFYLKHGYKEFTQNQILGKL